MPTVPNDGRPQFSFTDIAVANAQRGRVPLTGFEQIGPDRYVVKGSWPTPQPQTTGGASFPIEPEPERPKTPAQALWPNLPVKGTSNGP
jgi:hypothetical protein